jgi:CBS domain-containing protein
VKHHHNITEVMTADVRTVHRGQSLGEVWELLNANEFHHVPVVDGTKPVGMVSSTDIVKLVYNYEGTDDRMLRTVLDHEFSLEDAMSNALETVNSTGTIRHAADLMADGNIHSVLVVNEDGGLAGIVTSTDLIRFLRDQL